MIKANKMFETERSIFIKEMRIPSDLSYRKETDYYYGVRKAFDDAFNQYARRTKKTYSDGKEIIIKLFVKRFFDFLNDDNDNNDSFENCYEECVEKAQEILNNNKYGIAQKFINMSFKYMMCFSDVDEIIEKFDDCYLPLDQYTLIWIRAQKNKEINDYLNTINNAWSRIDVKHYKTIEEYVKRVLSNEVQYRISYSSNAGDYGYCILPSNRLCAEFIIWHQEKINIIHKMLEKTKSDFERLGIQMV